MPISTIGQNGLNAPITLTSPVINTVTSASATALTLQSAGTTAITVDTSQNVGIGTASPVSKLNVNGGSVTLAETNTGVYNIDFQSRTASTNARIQYDQLSNTTGQLLFYTNGGSLTERMRITSGGDVLVSTARSTARGLVDIPTSGGSAGVPLAVSRGGDGGPMVNFYSMSSTTTIIGSIANASNTNTTYNTSSDYRLKDEVTPMSGALDKVYALKPVTWKWKSTGEDGQGFIAHELAQVIPDCVTGEKDAVDADGNPVYQGVDTSYLVATLTAAIQELKTIVDAQAAEIAELKAKVA